MSSEDEREDCTLKTLVLASAVAVLAGVAMNATARGNPEEGAVDPRVEAALMGAGLAYTIDDGDFRLNRTLADGRTQRVWVASNTAKIDKLEFRDVWSVAYRAQGAPPANLAGHLLAENVRMVLGAWQVNQARDEYLVVFSTPIAAGADAATLAQVIEAVTLSADHMEKELTGKDEF
jgi:hypothetical protein